MILSTVKSDHLFEGLVLFVIISELHNSVLFSLNLHLGASRGDHAQTRDRIHVYRTTSSQCCLRTTKNVKLQKDPIPPS